MREIGRGERAFEAGPVQGTVTVGAPSDAAEGAVLLLDDETADPLPHGSNPVAVICSTGSPGDPLAEACALAGIPCVMGVVFDGGSPEEGSLVVVDCSGDEGVVMVVDGGVTEGGLEDVVASQEPG